MNTKTSFSLILVIFIIVSTAMYMLIASDQLHDMKNEIKALSHTSSGFIFTSLKECKAQEGQLVLPCESIFKVSDGKAKDLGKKLGGLATCRRFYDPLCKHSETGHLSPRPVGAFYLASKIPQIAPIFFSREFGSFILPSGCIIRKSDSRFKFNGTTITEFPFLNWSNLEREISVFNHNEEMTRKVLLHRHIKKNQNQLLHKRMQACIGHL